MGSLLGYYQKGAKNMAVLFSHVYLLFRNFTPVNDFLVNKKWIYRRQHQTIFFLHIKAVHNR